MTTDDLRHPPSWPFGTVEGIMNHKKDRKSFPSLSGISVP